MIWSPNERFLWGVTIALVIICALQYLNRVRKIDSFNEKLISFGYSTIFFGFVLNLIFLYLSSFLVPGNYIDNTFYGNYDAVDSTYVILVKISIIGSNAGFICFFFAFERIFKRTKYILTITLLIIILFIIITPYDIFLVITEILFVAISIVFLSILLTYTKWSRPELKAVSSFVFFGTILMMAAMILSSEHIKIYGVFPLVISPIFYFSGTILILIPTVIDLKFFSKAFKFWLILGISSIILYITLGMVFVYFGFTADLLIAIIVITLVILYSTIINTKTHKTTKGKEEMRNFLEAFGRPKKVTEEEVSVSKEKKICLVCKGKLVRKIYICPDCNTFYCNICADTLVDLENACWACNSPFDESKPSKPYEKEEKGEVIVEGKIRENSKKDQDSHN